jgi:hypothetical protein
MNYLRFMAVPVSKGWLKVLQQLHRSTQCLWQLSATAATGFQLTRVCNVGDMLCQLLLHDSACLSQQQLCN